jgi:hypothetical protein
MNKCGLTCLFKTLEDKERPTNKPLKNLAIVASTSAPAK